MKTDGGLMREETKLRSREQEHTFPCQSTVLRTSSGLNFDTKDIAHAKQGDLKRIESHVEPQIEGQNEAGREPKR